MNDINSNSLSLENIANGINPTDKELSDTKSQMRMFLIAQAKRELMRVVKLTEVLDKLQDVYGAKVMEYLEGDTGDELKYIPIFMDTIMKCLDRSNDIIRRISSDDKLFNIVYADFSTNVSNVTNSNIGDVLSRRKVREAVDSMINALDFKEATD